MNTSVLALTVHDGDLIVGGSFATAGGLTVNRIVRWDGSSWHPLASGGQTGTNQLVRSLTVYDGDVIAGGNFTTAGGQTVNHIARWDGSAWHAIMSGGQTGTGGGSFPLVYAMMQSGSDLIVGGEFLTAGGQTVNNIARWDGSSWLPFVTEGQNGVGGGRFHFIFDVALYSGDLIAAGQFTTAGDQTVNNIAGWACRTTPPIPGDITGDGNVGVADLLAVISAWGPCSPPPAPCPADIAPPPSGDGNVGVADLLFVISNWG